MKRAAVFLIIVFAGCGADGYNTFKFGNGPLYGKCPLPAGTYLTKEVVILKECLFTDLAFDRRIRGVVKKQVKNTILCGYTEKLRYYGDKDYKYIDKYGCYLKVVTYANSDHTGIYSGLEYHNYRCTDPNGVGWNSPPQIGPKACLNLIKIRMVYLGELSSKGEKNE